MTRIPRFLIEAQEFWKYVSFTLCINTYESVSEMLSFKLFKSCTIHASMER